jgi:hypothetical protein
VLRVTTGLFFTMDTGNFFPDEDFFSDISSLYDNMGDNGGIPNVNANANMGFSSALYVFIFINFMLQFLRLAIGLDMLDMLYSYRLLVNVVSLISMFLAIFYLLFSWIKYHDKLLIFPTLCNHIYT